MYILKPNMTGDSWLTLLGIVREADAGAGAGAGADTKKANGRASDDDNDDEDDDLEEPTENWRKWKSYATERGKRQAKERERRKAVEATLAQRESEIAALNKRLSDETAALLTSSKTEREAAIADAMKKADARLVRAEIKRALTDAKCQDVDAALQIIDASAIKVSEAGDVEGISDLLTQFKKDKAYLFGSQSTTSTKGEPPKPGDGKVNVKDMTDAEYKAYKRSKGLA